MIPAQEHLPPAHAAAHLISHPLAFQPAARQPPAPQQETSLGTGVVPEMPSEDTHALPEMESVLAQVNKMPRCF